MGSWGESKHGQTIAPPQKEDLQVRVEYLTFLVVPCKKLNGSGEGCSKSLAAPSTCRGTCSIHGRSSRNPVVAIKDTIVN